MNGEASTASSALMQIAPIAVHQGGLWRVQQFPGHHGRLAAGGAVAAGCAAAGNRRGQGAKTGLAFAVMVCGRRVLRGRRREEIPSFEGRESRLLRAGSAARAPGWGAFHSPRLPTQPILSLCRWRPSPGAPNRSARRPLARRSSLSPKGRGSGFDSGVRGVVSSWLLYGRAQNPHPSCATNLALPSSSALPSPQG